MAKPEVLPVSSKTVIGTYCELYMPKSCVIVSCVPSTYTPHPTV